MKSRKNKNKELTLLVSNDGNSVILLYDWIDDSFEFPYIIVQVLEKILERMQGQMHVESFVLSIWLI